MGAVRDGQLLAHVDAGFFERGHLLDQRERVHHDAIADDGGHPWAQNAAGDQFQDVFGGANEDGMAGVMPALIPRHDIEAVGKKIDDLSFSFVSPLCAQNDNVAHLISGSMVTPNQ